MRKKLTCKEIMELDNKKITELMTEEEWERMLKLECTACDLVDMMQDGVRLSDYDNYSDVEYASIDEYLKWIEELREYKKEELEELNRNIEE